MIRPSCTIGGRSSVSRVHTELICFSSDCLSPRFSRVSGCAGGSAIFGRRVNGSLSQSWQLKVCNRHKDTISKRWKRGNCTAELLDDAPFALAIGASILSTVILPVSLDQGNKEDPLFGPDDVRSGAMQIISFIPLFNWLVWVFAWLDTRQQRYLVFAIIYLAPYLKTGLSLSPDDSWLPAASVLAGIVHVQLDLSVNAEGGQPPLGDVAKVMLAKTQIKDLHVQTGGLVSRLKELVEKSSVQSTDTVVQEEDQPKGADWKAIQEEAQKKEFEEWDRKFSKSPKVEEADIDS